MIKQVLMRVVVFSLCVLVLQGGQPHFCRAQDTPAGQGKMMPSAKRIPAFPGAEGFGAYARGGRGGRVIQVTNLKDEGPGSFRAAVEAEGPRIVVFRVSGNIELKKGVSIR